MKTARTFSTALLGFVLSLFLFSEAGYSKQLIRTGATLYDGEWIPAVELHEVTITGTALEPGAGRFCSVVEHNGQLIPSVELNEVSICSEGTCENNNDLSSATGGRLLQVTDVHGVQMPIATCKEITIRPVDAEVAQNSSVQTESVSTVEVAPSTIGFRRTFDQLLTFVVLKGKLFLENLASSWFQK